MGRRLWITASAVALLWSGAAQAQQADAVETKADKDQAAVLGDVVVTAERRTSNLQTTAVAATVLSGEDLAAKGVLSLDQLQFAAPSTTVQNFGQGNFFNVRGIGKSEATTAVGVGVITYRDGVAAFPAYFQTEPYYDIGSLELLRGPQGTFAGANATGGAVFITARNPDFSGINGYVFGQAGNYNDVKLQGAINLPLTDTLAARLAFNHETRDSFYTIAGPYRGHPGVVDSNSVRASLLWQPTDALKVLWKTDYNNIDLGGYPADPALATNDPFHITSNGPNEAHDEFVRSSLNVSYVFDSGMTLKSITGYQAGRSRFATDLDGTSALNNTFVDQLDEEVWSQEFNLISPDQQRLTWLLGLYYQYDMARFPAKAFPTAEYRIGFPENVLDIYLWGDTPKETAAVFGQVSYDITDRLQLQVGARYAHSVSTNDDVYTTYPQFGIVLFQDDKVKDDKVTGKVTLNWKLDDANFVYGFVATGHKMGGLNAPNLYRPAQTFGAEDLVDYELGWKSTMLDGRLRSQIGAYYTVYQDYQVNIGDPQYPQISRIQNVQGDTKIMGLEASAQGRFGPLSFDVAGSVSNSEMGDFFGADPRLGRTGLCDPSTGPASANCVNIAGNTKSYAPEFTFNAGIEYAFPLGSNMTLTPRVDYAHIGESWTTIFNNAALGDRLGARDIVNASVRLNTGPWTWAVYALNATDETYIAAINSGLRYAGPPRQYGINLTRTF
ncbi:TonB-dependent receptor domain-containing protein [Brevundimonas sp.]|jgi:iron complex outermembrane receptor protein|uniref:TonB-dependent receptor n=1 Tax=Brevundimonas sp. TaxID=1871086 RepID=UPI0028A967F9|nr:TonB-dependent receptor [Brevundimonas sp.]